MTCTSGECPEKDNQSQNTDPRLKLFLFVCTYISCLHVVIGHSSEEIGSLSIRLSFSLSAKCLSFTLNQVYTGEDVKSRSFLMRSLNGFVPLFSFRKSPVQVCVRV